MEEFQHYNKWEGPDGSLRQSHVKTAIILMRVETPFSSDRNTYSFNLNDSCRYKSYILLKVLKGNKFSNRRERMGDVSIH